MRYIVRNTRMNGYVTTLTKKSKDILNGWLSADNLLYHYFKEAHEVRVRKFGKQKMLQAVTTLQQMNED